VLVAAKVLLYDAGPIVVRVLIGTQAGNG